MTDQNPPANPPSDSAGESADLMTRFLARLIDSFLLMFVMFAIIVPVIIVSIIGMSASSSPFGGFGAGGLVVSVVLTAIIIAYYAFLESSRGQTLGKMIMKIKTTGPDGQNPSLETAAKRNAFYLLGVIPVVGGLLQLAVVLYIAWTINESPDHTGWHDAFAGGTKVVKVG